MSGVLNPFPGAYHSPTLEPGRRFEESAKYGETIAFLFNYSELVWLARRRRRRVYVLGERGWRGVVGVAGQYQDDVIGICCQLRLVVDSKVQSLVPRFTSVNVM